MNVQSEDKAFFTESDSEDDYNEGINCEAAEDFWIFKLQKSLSLWNTNNSQVLRKLLK